MPLWGGTFLAVPLTPQALYINTNLFFFLLFILPSLSPYCRTLCWEPNTPRSFLVSPVSLTINKKATQELTKDGS